MNSMQPPIGKIEDDFDFADGEAKWEPRAVYRGGESARFVNEYRSFDFDAMAEIPDALDAFIDHQHSFDL